jgi:hypothetical protein
MRYIVEFEISEQALQSEAYDHLAYEKENSENNIGHEIAKNIPWKQVQSYMPGIQRHRLEFYAVSMEDWQEFYNTVTHIHDARLMDAVTKLTRHELKRYF